ncbi:hypothetical protein D3C78_1512410 [compost metagenome]
MLGDIGEDHQHPIDRPVRNHDGMRRHRTAWGRPVLHGQFAALAVESRPAMRQELAGQLDRQHLFHRLAERRLAGEVQVPDQGGIEVAHAQIPIQADDSRRQVTQ